jgi:hypothetical protein
MSATGRAPHSSLLRSGEHREPGPIDTIAPVGLAELVDQGELMSRVDRKYVVSRNHLTGLLAGLPAGTRVLEIDGRREFGYRSTYLDTPDHHSFLSSGRSHRGRWKVRGRVYLDSGASFLETKTVGPRGRTVKQRILHADLHENGLSIEGAAFVAASSAPGTPGRCGRSWRRRTGARPSSCRTVPPG